ncbi:hypothetical protein KEM54_000405 [Ascosphaera aggregata]|nr:hypothetical protein KEM54_000405 [Ascosphaera aggregata]
MPQRMIPPQPILEDEEQEVGMLELLEKKLSQIMQLADQVSVRARHLNHRLRNRANAINARRQNDVNLQSHIRQQHQQLQQLQESDPAAAGRLASRGPWASTNAASSDPQSLGIESGVAPANITGRDYFSDTGGHMLFEGTLRTVGASGIARGGAVPTVDAGRPDRHLDDVLSATSFLHSASAPENVTTSNGTTVTNASPSTMTEMMRKFLTGNEQTAAAADRLDGPTNHGNVHHNAQGISRPYIPPLPKSTTAHSKDEFLYLRANARVSSNKSPSRSGQQTGRFNGQGNGHRTTRDDGGPFKSEMIARMDALARGDRILPPCDRCRRLQIECRKNLTACKGCTKKHAKCSWKDVKIEELQITRPREGSQSVPMTESGAGLVRVTSAEDQQSANSPGISPKAERRKRGSSSAKSPSNSVTTELQTSETVSQQARQESEANAQPALSESSSTPPQPQRQSSSVQMTQSTGPAVPHAPSISVGALGTHSRHTPIIHAQQDASTTSPVVRPHSVGANVVFPSLPGYRDVVGSPPLAPSGVSASFSSKGLPDQLPPLIVPAFEQQEQQLEQPQYSEHTPAQQYHSKRHCPSFSRYQLQSPEQESSKDSSKDSEDGLHHQYGSPKNRTVSVEVSRRPENDPLSIAAISDTVAQHMAARAATETNASRSASGRPDSASAASASPRCSEHMAMTPNSAVTCSGSALTAPTCTAIDKLSSAGDTSLHAPSMGPLLSPSSGPMESKRAPSPIDVVGNESCEV